MKNTLDSIGINLGSVYARCACVVSKSAVPVMIPNRWGKTSTNSKTQDAVSLFRTLREDAEVFLGRFVSSCVLAVRSHFTPLQRETMTKAAEAAGMIIAGIVSEPAAAALAFGGGKRCMVLDAGACASDIAIVENEGGAQKTWKVLESERCADIGGRSFDLVLAEWLRERLGLDPMPEDDTRWLKLVLEAEIIKIALSSCLVYDWQPLSLGGRNFPAVKVEREELERMTRFSIKRLVNIAGRLWEKHRPERLLLVGGTSSIPLLREMAGREIAHPERLNFGPEEAIAAGAALYAALGQNSPEYVGSGSAENPLAAARRMRDLKTRLMRMEPSLSAAHQKRLHVMLDKMGGMENDSSSMELLEGFVKDLEKELFSTGS